MEYTHPIIHVLLLKEYVVLYILKYQTIKFWLNPLFRGSYTHGKNGTDYRKLKHRQFSKIILDIDRTERTLRLVSSQYA